MGRTSKPFNPLLGETYEMVTPEFRMIVETVCHHPPITALHVEGEGYEMTLTSQVSIMFTGKRIIGKENGSCDITLHLPSGPEKYTG